ncbi:MAG TPA: prolipoprotein diacylglyceryl transferase family protein, partial [Blastocatellia bacterium]|nr:prolipoprotein diacylglyceryl transferase family protein [Blastocatellia bacterium]
QLVESVWALFITSVGAALVLNGSPAGSALAWYVVTYDTGRFFLEFLRGDAERPYLLGFSQPQWISLLLMLGVSSAEVAGVLPFHAWHVVSTAGLLALMTGLSLARRLRKTPSHLLLHPRHIRELAEAVNAVSEGAATETTGAPWTVFPTGPARRDVPVACTSLGIRISTGRIGTGPGALRQFSLSHKNGNLSEQAARLLSNLLVQIERLSPTARLTRGGHGVFHVLASTEPKRSDR